MLTTRKLRDHLLPEDGYGHTISLGISGHGHSNSLGISSNSCDLLQCWRKDAIFQHALHRPLATLSPSQVFAWHLSASFLAFVSWSGDKPWSPHQLLHKGQAMQISACSMVEPTLKPSVQPRHCAAVCNCTTIGNISSPGPNPKIFQLRQSTYPLWISIICRHLPSHWPGVLGPGKVHLLFKACYSVLTFSSSLQFFSISSSQGTRLVTSQWGSRRQEPNAGGPKDGQNSASCPEHQKKGHGQTLLKKAQFFTSQILGAVHGPGALSRKNSWNNRHKMYRTHPLLLAFPTAAPVFHHIRDLSPFLLSASVSAQSTNPPFFFFLTSKWNIQYLIYFENNL